jgi:hypothetical protein
MKTNLLDYYDGNELLENNALRIGASSIGKYYTFTSQFFKELLLGEKGFEGSQATVLGTCVHYHLQCYVEGTEPNLEEVRQYILKQAFAIPDLDSYYINENIPFMVTQGIAYLQTLNLDESVAERFVTTEVRPGIFIGGSIDLLTMNEDGSWTINDYKTLSANSVASMKYEIKAQLMTYANVLMKLGEAVTNIRTINITTHKTGRVGKPHKVTGVCKPLPDQPSQIIIHETPIFQEDWDATNGMFDVTAESVELFIARPELRGVLSQDNRVKTIPCTYTPFIEEEI